MGVSISGSTGVTFPDNSIQTAAASPFGLKNRIINGDIRIDQRNAGASVTPSTGTYTADRWRAYQNVASKFTVQQVSANANTAQGFDQSLRITSSSAYTPSGSNLFLITQNIEGNNIVDLSWGTASAKTVTLSFWVYSSLTGTFGGSLVNGAETLSYPFTYTISSANTWEQKTITVAGPTTGTWDTSTGVGIEVNFGIGAGSTYQGTAGSWQSGAFFTATGTTNIVATNGATWQLTGVQLERNTTATPFEWLPYTTELQLCQRYYWRNAPGGGSIAVSSGVMYGSTLSLSYTQFPVAMRANPTGSVSAASDFTAVGGASTITPSAIVFLSSTLSSRVEATLAGATSGQGMILQSNNSSSWIAFSAE
ncbi:hypothetical protein UFOVP342_13 [uncultured Caudovirales phage]|uniref:Uncharacterized protein n=1 Tax=uncultured Caudovirales phage TaxID=2100421 RepID=A0A6J5M1E7_9CAUD|nr:hypothetical protein UFOVP342_13 [uncultured Caudovirales phage]